MAAPTTLEEVIDLLVSKLSEEDRGYIADRRNSYEAAHHGFGTAIRNDYGLWDCDSVLYRHFRDRFSLGHGDDMSALILAGIFAKVRGDALDFTQRAEAMRQFWIDRGLDPITQKAMPAPAKLGLLPRPRRIDLYGWLGLDRWRKGVPLGDR